MQKFCSFDIKCTKYYIICTKFIHTLGCHDQYCFINDIHQYVYRRFLNNLKCTIIHFKIIKNTHKKNNQVDSVYLHAQFFSSQHVYIYTLSRFLCESSTLAFRTEQSLHEKYLVCSTQIGSIAITCNGYITYITFSKSIHQSIVHVKWLTNTSRVVHIRGCFWSWIYFYFYSGFVNMLNSISLSKERSTFQTGVHLSQTILNDKVLKYSSVFHNSREITQTKQYIIFKYRRLSHSYRSSKLVQIPIKFQK